MDTTTEFEPERFEEESTSKFRIFFKKVLLSLDTPEAKIYISPFHDISLYSESGSNIYRMIVTSPRWTNILHRMSKTEPFNPIAPHVKSDRVLYAKNIFPFHGVPWNCGFLPQTWEMPDYEDPSIDVTLRGSNDVLEIIEIGGRVHGLGSLIDVKVLGAVALVDDNQVVWKILSIDCNDPMAQKLDDIDDVNSYMPGLIESTVEWFKNHKIPDGGQIVQLVNPNQVFGSRAAYEKIETSHKFWKSLIKNELFFRQSKECVNFKLHNTQCHEGNHENLKNAKEAEAVVEGLKKLIRDEPIESIVAYPNQTEVDTVFYIGRSELAERNRTIQNGDLKVMQLDDENLVHPWKTFLKMSLGRYVAPIAASSLISLLIYYAFKGSSNLKN